MKQLYKQIDISLPKSKSKWECICPSCNIIKILHWNSIKSKIDKNQFNCLTCILKERNKTLSKSEKVKNKQRFAKLGKFGKNANNWRGGGDRIKIWKEKNRELIRFRSSTRYRAKKTALENKRRANKLMQSPKWLNSQHNEQINLIYKEARTISLQTGIKHEVDHIIPLNGKQVRGLHVPWNLQIITETENRKKGNR